MRPKIYKSQNLYYTKMNGDIYINNPVRYWGGGHYGPPEQLMRLILLNKQTFHISVLGNFWLILIF